MYPGVNAANDIIINKIRYAVFAAVADICGQFAGRESQPWQYECISCAENSASFETVESSCALGRNAGIVH